MNEKTTAPPQNNLRRAVSLMVATAIVVIGGGYWWAHRGYTGYVASTHYAARSRGQPTFLNLGRAYPNQEMTVVIWRSDRAAFPNRPDVYYLHKTIRVRGRVTYYRSKPEIVVKSRNQIREE